MGTQTPQRPNNRPHTHPHPSTQRSKRTHHIHPPPMKNQKPQKAQKPQIHKHNGQWYATNGLRTTQHPTWTQALNNATPPPGARTCINCLRPMKKTETKPLGTQYERTTKLCKTCYYETDIHIVTAANRLPTIPNTNTTPHTYKKRILTQHHRLQRLADKHATQHAMNTDPALARYITERRERLAKQLHN